jgi:hypothetical protein
MWRFGPTRFGENSRDGVNGRLNRPSTRTAVERSADMSCDESAPRHPLLFLAARIGMQAFLDLAL